MIGDLLSGLVMAGGKGVYFVFWWFGGEQVENLDLRIFHIQYQLRILLGDMSSSCSSQGGNPLILPSRISVCWGKLLKERFRIYCKCFTSI